MTFLRAGDWTSNQVWNLVHADFIVKSMIGTGSDGVVVFEAIHRDSEEEVALKFIPVKSKYHRERALKELRLLEKVLHENVVWAYGMILGLELGVLVLERCKTDFFELLSAASQPFPEQKALIIFKQMLNAVIHCHRVGIAHRDIKLENFFLSNSGQVRLGDFGLAEPYQPDQVFMNSVGTPGYAAPEVMDAGDDRPCSPEAGDVFSLGATLYAMLVGDFPYPNKDFLQEDDCPSVPRKLSEPCRRLILSMTAVAPSSRPRLESILNHPWVKGVRLCKLTYSADSAAFVASLPSPTATRCTFAHLRRNANPVEQPTEIKNNPIECIA